MSTEVKTYNNQIIEPGYIVSDVKKIDDDVVMGLDFDENKSIKLITNDKAIYELPHSYLLISDLWKTALLSDTDADELDINIDNNTMKYIVEYLNIRKGTEIRIGYSHLAKMSNQEKEAEMKRLSDARISYKCKSVLMSENLPDNKEEVEFIDRFTAEEGGPALKAVLEAANYLGIHSLIALCAIKIRSFSIGVRTKDLRDRMEKIFRTGKYANTQ
jgi:hypothetical protein